MRGGRTGKYAWLCIVHPDLECTATQKRLPLVQAMPDEHAISELLAGREAVVFMSQVDGVLTAYEKCLAMRENIVSGPAVFSAEMLEGGGE